MKLEMFDPPPTEIEPDARQTGLRAMLQEHKERHGPDKVTPIAMRGFRASQVDLGWLHDQIASYCQRMRPGADELVSLIEAELPEVVQRTKQVVVDTEPWPAGFGVTIQTKDDYTNYIYCFAVALTEDDDAPAYHFTGPHSAH